MKRIAALLLAVIPLLFAACGEKKSADSTASPDSVVRPATPDSTRDEATPDQKKVQPTTGAVSRREQYAHSHPWYRAEKTIDKNYFSKPLKHRSAQIDTEELLQNPELPTGCESVALTSALRSLGFDVGKTEIADDYLIYGDDVMWSFVGDPEEIDGAGIYPPGLTNCANDYLRDKKSNYTAYNTMGVEFEDLFKLIENGCPVLLWTTMDYEYPVLADVAFDYKGTYVYWYELEHCVMLCGYDLDEGEVTINDPMEGIITKDLDQIKEIYDGIDRLSLTIMKNTGNIPAATGTTSTTGATTTAATKSSKK